MDFMDFMVSCEIRTVKIGRVAFTMVYQLVIQSVPMCQFDT